MSHLNEPENKDSIEIEEINTSSLTEESTSIVLDKETAETEVEAEAPYTGIINKEDVDGNNRYEDVFTIYQPDAVQSVKRIDNTFIFTCENKVVLKVNILEEGLFQLTYSYDGWFQPEFSYAIDPKFKAAAVTPAFVTTNEGFYIIRTGTTVCKIQKSSLKVSFEDVNGNVINEDADGYFTRATIHKGITDTGIKKKTQPNEVFLGLGDKTKPNNLHGFAFENWNSDTFAFGRDTSAMYRSIPFYYGFHEHGKYGIFFDNTYKSHFDFNSQGDDITSFHANGGETNYYFIHAETATAITETYARLTGKHDLPPMWGLGFHQCRWSYYPEARVREIADTFREKQIPCDAIYLDIDYMDGYRCFTWNYNHFPNPKGMLKDLKDNGFHTVVMIDPGIMTDDNYFVYTSGVENDVFCKRPNGRLMTGPVWPRDCAFPDFTNPKTRAWWGPLYKDLYNDTGVSGFWNDMNEPAVFEVLSKTFPDDIRHDYEGQSSDHRRAHNVYGMQMSRASYEGLQALQPNKRPILITRATYSGGQRYGSTWTGDNVADWDHLKIANTQCQRLSISGFSYVGTDIGGFLGEPTGELMVRWLQLGIFHPLYRVHSMGNKTDGAAAVSDDISDEEKINPLNQEPWSYGEPFTKYGRMAIELRYRLLGYLYTAFQRHSLVGTPILRPLFFDYPTVQNADSPEFLWGDQLLVAPVLDEAIESLPVQLPEGLWYDLKGTAFEGNQVIHYPIELETVPIFAKAGSVIPLYPVRQHTGEKLTSTIELKAFYKAGEHSSSLYEDAGEGLEYQETHYSKKTFTVKGSQEAIRIEQKIKGDFNTDYSRYQISFYGLPFTPKEINVNGRILTTDNNHAEYIISNNENELTIKVNKSFGWIEIQ